MTRNTYSGVLHRSQAEAHNGILAAIIVVLKQSLVLFPILTGCAADVGFEHSGKMTGGGKAEIGADGGEGLVRIAEEAFGFLRFFFQDEVCQALARLLLEFAGEVRAAEEQLLRDFLRCNGLGHMVLDVAMRTMRSSPTQAA